MNQLNIHTDTHNLNELHKGVEAINQNNLNTHLFKGYIIDIYSFWASKWRKYWKFISLVEIELWIKPWILILIKQVVDLKLK